MEDSVLRLGKTGVDFAFKTDSSELFIKREDRIFFSQGTKIRKLLGIYKSILPKIQDGSVRKIVLQGNLHSNAILAGVLFFRFVGVTTKVLGYSRNPKLITPASILANRFSELELYSSRVEWNKAVEEPTKSPDLQVNPHSGEVILPEFLFCDEALDGLQSLWEEIDPTLYDRIILDVGSGLTWISAILWGKLPVIGISLGLQKEKFVSWMRNHLSSLRQNSIELPWESLLDPSKIIGAGFSFGKKGDHWSEKSNEYQKRFGLYLEPIYAAKSVSVIEEMMKNKELDGRNLYIYQGGILQSGISSIL
ncbi:1-aminocyclopropane-1-carboxylate deaminase [Leptospira sarikeiensis]|uniref:1-aminocyclopropane-1-carboxylate deaminase n=1 Tax=Leptospira sarikeiensis TaxID=2484943 RepID=A0A4R9K9K5_9LEPT|nr:1-aminocyclopropane-1-carboxylate deaminase [Leptospira sarikeiensis]TGL62372.1 1-aminocyclopropane-1-carboxylate deaminase [Leptospira sarikeiensis]